MSELHRITSRPQQLGGAPCIRHLRIRVADVVEMLKAGEPDDIILASFPYLEPEDLKAVREFISIQNQGELTGGT